MPRNRLGQMKAPAYFAANMSRQARMQIAHKKREAAITCFVSVAVVVAYLAANVSRQARIQNRPLEKKSINYLLVSLVVVVEGIRSV